MFAKFIKRILFVLLLIIELPLFISLFFAGSEKLLVVVVIVIVFFLYLALNWIFSAFDK